MAGEVTKEQMAELRRLADEPKCACHQKGDIQVYVCRHTLAWMHVCTTPTIRTLLADADRLAAIEAVTGNEVRDLIALLEVGPIVAESNRKACAAALLAIPGKIAEQAEEIAVCDRKMQTIEDTMRFWHSEAERYRREVFDVTARAEAAEAKCKELEEQKESDRQTLDAALRTARAVVAQAESERDTLRRLLTETALPAMEIGDEFDRLKVAETIRAQMEDANG